MGFVKNRIKKYINNIISEVMDEKYNNGDFCQHDWELIMNNEIFKGETSKRPKNLIKDNRSKKREKENRYFAQEQYS